MIKLGTIVFLLLIGVFAVIMFLSTCSYLEERNVLVKDYIAGSLNVVGRQLDKNKMYHFNKKTNKIIVMDNPNMKGQK